MSLLPQRRSSVPRPLSLTRCGAGHSHHAVGRPLVASPGSAGSEDSVGIHRAVLAPCRRFRASHGAAWGLGKTPCALTPTRSSSGGERLPSGVVRPSTCA